MTVFLSFLKPTIRTMSPPYPSLDRPSAVYPSSPQRTASRAAAFAFSAVSLMGSAVMELTYASTAAHIPLMTVRLTTRPIIFFICKSSDDGIISYSSNKNARHHRGVLRFLSSLPNYVRPAGDGASAQAAFRRGRTAARSSAPERRKNQTLQGLRAW